MWGPLGHVGSTWALRIQVQWTFIAKMPRDARTGQMPVNSGPIMASLHGGYLWTLPNPQQSHLLFHEVEVRLAAFFLWHRDAVDDQQLRHPVHQHGTVQQATGNLHNGEQSNRACHPGGHYKDYYPEALSLSQVTATHFQIRHLVPDLKISYSDLAAGQGTMIVAPAMAARVTGPIEGSKAIET